MASESAIKAGGAFVELFTRDTLLERGLRAAQKKVQVWAAGLQRLGAGVIALGAGLLAPLLGATKAFADSGDMLDKMAGRTGVAVEQLSALQFAAEQSGSSLGTIEKALRRMATTLFDAERGSKESVDALAAIGLTADQLKGLAPDEQFLRMADGLSRIENASMKAALAQKLFGRSGTELLPLLNGGQKGVRALVDEAQRLGIVMSTDQASAAAKFTDAWNRIKRQFQQIVVTIGSAVAPMLLELFSNVKGFLRGVIDWVRQNEALVQTLALVGGGLVIAGTAIIGLAVALKVLAIGMGLVLGLFALIKGAIVLLVSPVGLVVAGLTGLAAWFLKSTEAGQKMLGVLSSGFASIKADALEAFGGIKDALAVGNMGLAMEILVAFLKLQWKKFVVYLTTNWAGFVDFFFQAIDSVKEAWNALKETFIVIGGFLKTVWTSVVNFVVKIWNGLISVLQEGWNKFAGFINRQLDKLPKKLDPGFRIATLNFGNAKVDTTGGGDAVESPAQKTRRERAEADLADARKEFNDLILKAAKARADAEANAKVEKQKPVQQVQQAAKAAVETASRSVGTFSAAVANRTAFDGQQLPRLQLNATNQTNAKLDRIHAELRDNPLVWGS